MGIGAALDMLLKARNKKPGTLATETGISKNTIYGIIKRDNKKVDLAILDKIAANLGVSVDFFFDADKFDGSFDISDYPSFNGISRRAIPMLGSISCGEPTFAEEDFQYYVSVGAEIHADFALRASGDSMIGARIFDGDIVFVREQPDVEDGQIAVVLIDDDTLLKRVYKLPDGRVQLRAENPRYAPITVGGRAETRTVKILGRAIAVQTDVI